MQKLELDYQLLDEKLNKKSYRLAEVKDQIHKVAFNMVRFNDPDKSVALWEIRKDDNGEYIVAVYDDSDQLKTASNDWEVSISKISQDLYVFYKGTQLAKISKAQLEQAGIPSEDLALVKRHLPAKLANNSKLVKSLLKQVPNSIKEDIVSRFPELTDE